MWHAWTLFLGMFADIYFDIIFSELEKRHFDSDEYDIFIFISHCSESWVHSWIFKLLVPIQDWNPASASSLLNRFWAHVCTDNPDIYLVRGTLEGWEFEPQEVLTCAPCTRKPSLLLYAGRTSSGWSSATCLCNRDGGGQGDWGREWGDFSSSCTWLVTGLARILMPESLSPWYPVLSPLVPHPLG